MYRLPWVLSEGGAVSGLGCILVRIFSRKLLGIIDELGQLLDLSNACGEKKRNALRQCIEFKEVYDSVRWEVLYNIIIEFGIPMKW